MGVQDLQSFLEGPQVTGGSVPVDLLRIAHGFAQRQARQQQRGGKSGGSQHAANNKLSLVVDGECCLDRLYGGYFSDWACGGQWNRMVQFLAVLIQTVQTSHIELAVFFNGCLEQQRMGEWIASQQEVRKKINQGSLETKEYILSEVAKGLGLSPDRFCILAALLGNYLLTEQDLADFYRKLGMTQNPGKIPVDVLVKTVAGFVKNLPSIDNLDAMAVQVFGSSTDKRATKLKQSVQYYLNGTKDGFLRYRPQPAARRSDVAHFSGQTKTPPQANNKGKQAENIDTSRFASETAESERDSLAAYNEATANATKAPQIVIEPPAIGGQGDVSKTTVNELNDCDAKNHTGEEEDTALTVGMSNSHAVNGGNHSASLLISSSSSSSSSSATSPSRLTPDVGWNSQNTKSATGAEDVIGPASNKLTSLPQIPPEVMRTASERHQKGLMSPYIYQILTQGEIKLPVLMEDETHKELPSIHLLYRPVRQMVYAILFNLHHHMYMASKCKEKGEPEKCEIPELRVKEWVWSRNNPYQTPDLVKAEQIGWGVPTIQRLWFGAAIDDKRRRLRAFLTCMRSDTPLMLNPAYVPQHLLVMASVLRYIMSFTDKKILRKPELDAFIAQAFSPELMNAHYLQELQVNLSIFFTNFKL
ncbi:hypothetical protein ANN_07779 [Periplaneta americana]|uniref:Constitutive coactivator of PPAR-gamma-like protein 1 homolog n=1 Tax=Periplaneta americana TaxID=6978 RepID=A0ABQ8T0X6_PERAM|nr:hypothetical protein ANN_07779 [Periplaneta americana]